MRRALRLLVHGALLLAAPLAAQAEEQTPPRWAFSFGLALNSSGGNERLTVGTAQTRLTRLQTDAFELALSARTRYGRSQGEEVARNVRAGINLDLFPEDRWSPFLFTTVEHDPFKRLDIRATGGFGAKRVFWKEGDWSDVSLSGAVLFSYETLAPTDSEPGAVARQFRWSWRFRARRRFGTGLELEHVTFYQPLLDRSVDFLAESRTAGRVAVTEHVSFAVAYLLEYDNAPPPDVRPEDWALTVGVEMSTRW